MFLIGLGRSDLKCNLVSARGEPDKIILAAVADITVRVKPVDQGIARNRRCLQKMESELFSPGYAYLLIVYPTQQLPHFRASYIEDAKQVTYESKGATCTRFVSGHHRIKPPAELF